MKIETLQERITKATAKIERKAGTITKKHAYIAKKQAELEKMGYAGLDRKTYYHLQNEGDDSEALYHAYWIICDIESAVESIENNTKEIEETKKTLAKYEAQLAGEIEKEATITREIPETMKRMQNELVTRWDAYDIERRERLKKEYSEMSYRDFIKKNMYAGYNAMFATDEDIHNENINASRRFILDLYNRIKSITGEVTDWADIHLTQGAWGCPTLNGYVQGKEGRAYVESILAGGYNIQRLHIRTIVHEI